MPLWKLKLTEEEYTNLKETLAQNAYRLEDFGIEAALFTLNGGEETIMEEFLPEKMLQSD